MRSADALEDLAHVTQVESVVTLGRSRQQLRSDRVIHLNSADNDWLNQTCQLSEILGHKG